MAALSSIRRATGTSEPHARPERRDHGDFWPDRRQELLLHAALDPSDAAGAAWQEVRPQLRSRRLDPGSRRLLPLVHANLRRLGMGDPELAMAGRVYRETLVRNEALLAVAEPLVQTLVAAGIDVAVLKGWPLAVQCYRDLGLRPMWDVDIVVRPTDAAAAADTIERLGWRPTRPLTAAVWHTRHATEFTGPGGHCCDLHWSFFEERCPPDLDAAFWTAAEWLDLGAARVRVLAPTDQLLHVCVHGLKWSPAPGIRWIADAMLLLRTTPVDWDRLVEQAVGRSFVHRTRLALRFLRERLDAPIPTAPLARLDAIRPVWRERGEYWARTRDHPWLGSLPFHWFNHLRISGRSAVVALPSFSRYLQDLWGVDSLVEVPGNAATRALKRVRLAMRRSGRDSAGFLP